MADITYTLTDSFPEDIPGFEQYSEVDKNLIESFRINNLFDPEKHFTELHVYSLADDLLESERNYSNYTFLGNAQSAGRVGASTLSIDPIKDSIAYGYPNGGVKLLYHFVNDLFTQDKSTAEFFINAISDDRTELRLLASTLDNNTVEEIAILLTQKLVGQSYFDGFRLNFGSNDLFIGINIGTIEYNGQIAVTIKLYEPLPTTYDVGSTLNIVEIISDSVSYEVATQVPVQVITPPTLRSPNFNIDIQDDSVVPSQYLNYNDLFSYPVNNSNSQIYSVFNEKGIEISIDYTDYNDFVHFSSAQERLINFKYKLDLITGYSASLSTLSTTSPSLAGTSGSTAYYNGLIQGVVSNFDHYERYLYYTSESNSWPKTNNTKPYINAQSNLPGTTTPNPAVTAWYSNQANDAAYFDSINNNLLVNTIPAYLRDDANNENYLTFIHMVGQHFDNLWLYGKAVSDKYDADNRLDFGISRDLVAEALKNFGVQLYTSNKSIQDLFTTIIGQGYQSGSEQITNYITGSYTGSNASIQPSSFDTYQKEIYKRIYHNLPLLLSSKGTERGLRALINCFGIPQDILQIKLYGGRNTNERSFYGDYQYYTSSLDKIRLDNTGSIVTGSTLSNYVSIIKRDDKYTDDLHPIEVGFSPTDNIDTYISNNQTCINYSLVTGANTVTVVFTTCQGNVLGPISVSPNNTFTFTARQGSIVTNGTPFTLTPVSTFSSFNIDDYVGDPRNLTSDTYTTFTPAGVSQLSLQELTRQVMSGSQASGSYNVPDFVRLIKFFDNTIFKMVKDFIPARAVADTGIIIKPHLLGRSKAKSVILSGSRPGYSGSIDTAFIGGTSGNNTILNTSYTETAQTPNGLLNNFRHTHEEARYNGELSNSEAILSNGELNSDNTFKTQNIGLFNFETGFVSESLEVCTLSATVPQPAVYYITSSTATYYGAGDIFQGTNTSTRYSIDPTNTNVYSPLSPTFPRTFGNLTPYAPFHISASNTTSTAPGGCTAITNLMFVTCSINTTPAGQAVNVFTLSTPAAPKYYDIPSWFAGDTGNLPTAQYYITNLTTSTTIGPLTRTQVSNYQFLAANGFSGGNNVQISIQDPTIGSTCSKAIQAPVSTCNLGVIPSTSPRGEEFQYGFVTSTLTGYTFLGQPIYNHTWTGFFLEKVPNRGIASYFSPNTLTPTTRFAVFTVTKRVDAPGRYRCTTILPLVSPSTWVNGAIGYANNGTEYPDPNSFFPGGFGTAVLNETFYFPSQVSPLPIGIKTPRFDYVSVYIDFIFGGTYQVKVQEINPVIAIIIKAFDTGTLPYNKLNPPACRQQVILYGDATKFNPTLPPGNPTFVNTDLYADYDEVTQGIPGVGSGVEIITVPMRTWSNGQVF